MILIDIFRIGHFIHVAAFILYDPTYYINIFHEINA